MSEDKRRGGGVVALAVVVFVVCMGVGYWLFTSPPDGGDAFACQTQTVKAGEQLSATVVAVDVYNGGDKEGLAGRVSTELQQRGFRAGRIANSQSAVKPKTATILTTDKSDPRVELVAGQFDDVDFRKPDFATGSAVTVIVGDDFDALKQGAPTSIKASKNVTLCY